MAQKAPKVNSQPPKKSSGQARYESLGQLSNAYTQLGAPPPRMSSGQSRAQQLGAVVNALQHKSSKGKQRESDQMEQRLGRDGDSWARNPYHAAPTPQPSPRKSEDLPFVFEAPSQSMGSSAETILGSAPQDIPRTTTLSYRPAPPVEPEKQHYVPATPSDPTRYRLAPVRELPISAPIQPFVTDMRTHVEQDHQQRNMTLHFTQTWTVTFRPGELFEPRQR